QPDAVNHVLKPGLARRSTAQCQSDRVQEADPPVQMVTGPIATLDEVQAGTHPVSVSIQLYLVGELVAVARWGSAGRLGGAWRARAWRVGFIPMVSRRGATPRDRAAPPTDPSRPRGHSVPEG